MKKQEKICMIKINENIRAVENNQPLTMPLRELKNDCRFMKFYNDFNDIKYGSLSKAKRKEYNQRPEIKAKQKEYNKKYYQRPEIKAKHKEYYQKHKEEIKAKQKEYQKEYYRKKFNIPKSKWRVK